MTHAEIPALMAKMDQAKKVKFLNKLRETVADGDTSKKISDFDLIRFVCQCPANVWALANHILQE